MPHSGCDVFPTGTHPPMCAGRRTHETSFSKARHRTDLATPAGKSHGPFGCDGTHPDRITAETMNPTVLIPTGRAVPTFQVHQIRWTPNDCLASSRTSSALRITRSRLTHKFPLSNEYALKKEPVPAFAGTGSQLWRRPTFAQPIEVLSSGLQRFTSVFGMGTGGATALRSPEGCGHRNGGRPLMTAEMSGLDIAKLLQRTCRFPDICIQNRCNFALSFVFLFRLQ